MTFVLGVDLDGVCGDYTETMKGYAAADLGVAPEELTSEVSWNYSEWGYTREQFMALHDEAVQSGLFRHMDVMENCADVLWQLSDADVHIRLITHRLCRKGAHEKAVSDTVAWLDDNHIPYRDLCFLGDKPQAGADLYIDDAVHNIEALEAAGKDVIIFDQPYNEHLEGQRAWSWADVYHWVMGKTADDRPGYWGWIR